MEDSIRLGRIGGVPVGVNWTLLVIFALVAFGVAGGRLPEEFPGYAPGTYVLAGVAVAILFFASILAHELGHALLARRKGVAVEGITLWLFGGVARFATEPEQPSDELRIAAVGPLISLAAGALFWGLGLAAAAVGVPDLVVALLGWLALVNVVLAVFNLFPAAPLDGGRILRAWLWRRSGDRRKAAVTASRAGRAFGLLLIGLGIVELAFGAGLGGLWFMLIGFFILTAARGEETHARLRGLHVRDVMTPDPVTAPDWLTIADFLERFVFAHRFSTFPLTGFSGDVTGIVTLRAVKRVPPDRRAEQRVRDIACPLTDVPVAAPDDDLVELLPRLAGGCSDGRALVLVDGELVGIVSPTDVARLAELTDLGAGRPDPHMS
jgi:Zn-dependent protease